jgi:hypothetical protein
LEQRVKGVSTIAVDAEDVYVFALLDNDVKEYEIAITDGNGT